VNVLNCFNARYAKKEEVKDEENSLAIPIENEQSGISLVKKCESAEIKT